MQKTYVVDTNVLLEDEKCIEVLRNGAENHIIIPLHVIEELDKLKKDPIKRELVLKAVDRIEENFDSITFAGNPDSISTSDMRILSDVHNTESVEDAVVITNDKMFRLICHIKNIDSQPYMNSHPIKSESEKYTGFIKEGETVVPNCFEWSNGVPIFHGNKGPVFIEHTNKVWNVTPRNVHQNLAMQLLLDPSLDLVTLQSVAGLGKTYIALAVAMYLAFEKRHYEKIFITKSPIEVGPEMGFLPGDAMEKLAPYIKPMSDLVRKLVNQRTSKNDIFIENKLNPEKIEIIPLAYMRGMNIDNAIVICDEVQNMARNECRTVLTRMGRNVRTFCLGDTNQVDNKYLNQFNNGLNWIVTLCKGEKNYGHIVLKSDKSRGPVTDLVLKVGL